jgi:RNA polymerase sigma factor (sigma-70 family)
MVRADFSVRGPRPGVWMKAMMSDAELFQDYLRKGDRAALDNLFARHYSTVYHVVLKLVRNSADASDITQATFLKALESARGGRPPHDLRPWLLRIAINAVRQWKRGDRRRAREDWLFEACRRDPGGRAPDLDAERREFERALEHALEGFPAELAEPLVLHYYENLSYVELGDILGLSKTTVQFRIGRALDKLREHFKSQGLPVLASLLPKFFPARPSSKPLIVGLALMNAKKIAVLLLIVLGVVAVGRRVWMTSTSKGVARSGNDASKAGAADRGKTAEGVRDVISAPGIFGTVFDQRTGLPVPGALISAYDLESAQKLATLSNERGAYRVPCPDSRGTWHLKISREGYASQQAPALRVSSEPRHVFLPQGGTIRGRLTDADGAALAPCRILAVRRLFTHYDQWDLTRILYQQVLPRDGIVEESRTVYGADGTFEIPHLSAGLYVLLVMPPGAAPFVVPLNQRLAGFTCGLEVKEGAVCEVQIPKPRPGSARIRVTDATSRAPIAGAIVEIQAEIDRNHLPLPESRHTTNAAGECVLPASLNERGSLDWGNFTVSKEGYGTAQGSFGLEEDGTLVEIRLGGTGRIQGHVRGPDGRPLEGCAVYVEVDGDGSVVDQAFTNAEGFYRTRELSAPRNLHVTVVDPGLSRPRTMTPTVLRDGETHVLDFGTATGAGICGTVWRKGKPCARALVCVDALQSGRRRTVFYADDQGAFAIEGLDPGPYELFVNAGTEATGDLSFARRLTLAEGDRKEFHFKVGARSILGTVVDAATQAPLGKEDSVDIVAREAGHAEPVASTRSREDGTFELLLEDSGVYEVDIADQDSRFYGSDRLCVDLSGETVVENARLLVHRDSEDRKIRIRLRDLDSGEPVLEGSYRFSFRGGSGVGGLDGDVIRTDDARIGSWQFRVEADLYLPELVTLEVRPEDRELERTLDLRKSNAVRVKSLKPSSPAERAGLRPDDLVVACNGLRVRNVSELQSICKTMPATQSVSLSTRRGSMTLDLVVSDPDLGIESENGSQK